MLDSISYIDLHENFNEILLSNKIYILKFTTVFKNGNILALILEHKIQLTSFRFLYKDISLHII